MASVTVVGSGASGVHFALTLLRKGHEVRMLDAGYAGEAPLEPDSGLNELKRDLPDPVEYFLGEDLYGLTLPGADGEFYGFPPPKRFVFDAPPGVETRNHGFEPLFSYARGGLAGAWTAGVYPFHDDDLDDFPFSFDELEPYYSEVAARIGVTGEDDDLTRFMPLHANLLEPLELDPHARTLLERYRARRAAINARQGCFVGRSRVATLPADREGRRGCDYLGRCLWGCPIDALYTPAITLAECRRYPSFRYEPGVLAEAFEFDESRRIAAVRVRPTGGGPSEARPVENLALAAGTLSTARIFLESWLRGMGERIELDGLMDNRQVLVPFVSLSRIGKAYEPRSYQYHQLSLGLETGRVREYVHGQITTLTTAQAHPILQTIPLDLKSATYAFRNVRGALGLVNLNFHDQRRPECRVGLAPGGAQGASPSAMVGGAAGEDRAKSGPMEIRYEPAAGEPARIRDAVRRLKRVLRRLGCLVAPGTVYVRPMGASVHYAGTLPMSGTARPRTVSPECRSHDFENLYVVDGSSFPFLPAKNITFTLMANAVRVAEAAF